MINKPKKKKKRRMKGWGKEKCGRFQRLKPRVAARMCARVRSNIVLKLELWEGMKEGKKIIIGMGAEIGKEIKLIFSVNGPWSRRHGEERLGLRKLNVYETSCRESLINLSIVVTDIASNLQ